MSLLNVYIEIQSRRVCKKGYGKEGELNPKLASRRGPEDDTD